jgi:hypothetical protein
MVGSRAFLSTFLAQFRDDSKPNYIFDAFFLGGFMNPDGGSFALL